MFMRMKNPVHPGEILKEDILAEAGVTVTRAVEILGLR
jgi:plasmid maintenance system antidote protein VapI